MKRFICLYLAFICVLVGFNHITGRPDRGYKDSVNSAVEVVNKIGDVSNIVLSTFLPSSSVSDLPYAYRQLYSAYSPPGVEHDTECQQSLIRFVYNCYYSDVKKYYKQEGTTLFNNTFESNVLGWSRANSKEADPSAVEELYKRGSELGYPMDNPYLNNVKLEKFLCICDDID